MLIRAMKAKDRLVKRVVVVGAALGFFIGLMCIPSGLRAQDDEFREIERTSTVVPVYGQEAFVVPKADNISAILIELYNHPLNYPAVSEFEVPPKEFPAVLSYFEGAEIDPMPETRFPETGSMKIIGKEGFVRRVSWYWPLGKGRLHFSFAGVRLKQTFEKWEQEKRDEALSLDLFLRRQYFELTGKETRRSSKP